MSAEPFADLPGYTVQEQLYTGVRSTVYRGLAVADRRPVILKIAYADAITLDESFARLRRELTILQSIRSPRVPTALEVVRLSGAAALVLDDFGGEALDRYVARGRLSLPETLALAISISAALRDVHAAGVIHRDVAPANITYNAATGQARLIDFDIATTRRTEHHGFVSPRTLEGTLRYMAPEQTGRMNRAMDSRADLYAFGATLFELLTGRTPFVDGDILAIVHAHLAVRPPPADSIDPAIPRPLAAIVSKLLAKAPEDRYQTAAGLLDDLHTCLEQLISRAAIHEFPLGRRDVATRFALPTRLFGRRAELAALTGAFERACAGSVEIAVVSGSSGVGKTSVVRELFPVITRARANFLQGKFDQLRGDAPYSALVSAFDALIHQLLTESEPELARWRERIIQAIAPNGQVVIDALPALERVIGPQPAVAALDGAATRSRFQITLQRFIQVFARREHPLVVFIDDMQWADPESIQLIKRVALSNATEALLVIEAHRDNEVSDSHPIITAVRELRGVRRVTELALAPLKLDDVAALIAETLHREPEAVAPLARLVCRKTDGNPFFVRQLLLALREAGHITIDPAGGFAFDAQAIERAPISENVADLLAANLRKLPAQTQRTLAMAAAIGNRFELAMLAVIAETSPAEIHAALAEAIAEDLVVPLGGLEFVGSAAGGSLVFARLSFQHDRVQRAAYALMSADEQQRMHLQIGRLVLACAGGDPADRLFDVVSHLNRAVGLIDEPARIRELARLDVAAACKARGSAAYAAAGEFLRVAVACFDWTADYAEQLDAHAMLAECAYLTGEVHDGLGVLDAAAAHASGSRDRGRLEALRARLYIHANDMPAAIACTRRASALLGLALPDDPAALGAGIGAAIHDIIDALAGRTVAQLLDLPVMTDLDAVALTRLYWSAIPAAFQHEPPLGAFITTQLVRLSLAHGNSPCSAFGYGVFASLLRGSPANQLAGQFGRLGLELNRRLDDRTNQPAVEFAYAMFSAPWLGPLHDTIAHLRSSARIGREIGDHVYAGNGAAHEIGFRALCGGEPLTEIRHDAERYRQGRREVGDVACERLLGFQIDRLDVLLGELEVLPAGAPDEDDHAGADANPVHLLARATVALDVAYARGDAAGALALATTNRALEASVPGMMLVVEHQLYHSLAAAAVSRETPARAGELAAIIDDNQQILARWVAECPANFEAMHCLVEAERAALRGDSDTAQVRYARAIASAARHGLRRIEALAAELCGAFYVRTDMPELAQVWLGRARALYAAMTAQLKVRMLDRKYPALVRPAPQSNAQAGSITTTTAADLLDVSAIAKATRAISGELELDRLLARMLGIIFENAGADGGALVLERDGALGVAALCAAGGEITTQRLALADAALPRSIIHYVQRTGAAVVLDDAAADRQFASDEHIRTHAPRSVLCLPVQHKDRTIGMLYLENTLVSGAFTRARLEALTILASQLAVSLENASLFAAQRSHAEHIERINDELRAEISVRQQAEAELGTYRDHLEELIAERTGELTRANQLLRDAADQRERIEAELRLAQKLESVGRLAAGVAHEINTPVQFVSDNITFVRDALPGVMDAFAAYHALASAAAAQAPAPAAAAASANQAADDADVDYALSHTQSALAAALDGLGRVTRIVRAMKDFAHPDREEKTLVDLNRAIESTLMIAANECKYVADVHTDLAPLPLVRCNCGEINQAVLNLVINAAHAIQDVVGVTGAKGRIGVRTRSDGTSVEIAISDTGTGIPAAIHDKLFDPFFTTKGVGRGTGQGLAIARNVVVDKHGGQLQFETAPGTGTTFYIRLPLGDALGGHASALAHAASER